jgi:PAS domain S-box-containing protein
MDRMSEQTRDMPSPLPRASRAEPEHFEPMDSSFYRQILDTLPAAVYLTDCEGRITYYNEAAVDLWGHRPPLGTSRWNGSWKLYWPDGRPMRHDECPMAITVRDQRSVRGFEAVAERPDGSRTPFIPYPTPLYDQEGKFIGAINMLVDASDRQRAELFADRLVAIVQSSNDAIISKSTEGIVTSWNPSAERLFGYTAEEMVGRSITLLIPPQRMDEEPAILERIRNGERIEHYETVRQRKDGTLVEISLSVSPVRDGDGRIVGAAKIARDITDRKRAEETQKLLLNEVKHRLNNTLANVQAIAMQTLKGVSREQFDVFNARLGALAGANELLTLERWNQSPLSDVVAGALKPFERHGAQRIIVSPGGEAWLSASRSLMLALLLHELATNAVKYGALSNHTGEIHLSWETPPDGESMCVRLEWRETGGPSVQPPTRGGFGSVLMDNAVGAKGKVQRAFLPEGLICTLEFEL